MNLTFQHLPFETLADLADDRLATAAKTSARAHLNTCQRCAQQFARLSQTLTLMRTDETEDAPPAALSSVVNLFRQRAAIKESAPSTESAPSLVRRVLGALSFDSLTLTPAYGVRSGQATARQMLFSAGENDVDVRVTQSGERWVVSGQVLGECSGGRVELAGAEAAVAGELNELCEFVLPAVAAGSYTLRLRLHEVEVLIPDLLLKG